MFIPKDTIDVIIQLLCATYWILHVFSHLILTKLHLYSKNTVAPLISDVTIIFEAY